MKTLMFSGRRTAPWWVSPASPLAPQRPLRGIALKLGSVVCFIVMAALIKAVSAHVPAGQTVFFRSVFAIPVIVVWLALRHELTTGFRAVAPLGHVWRGFVGTLSMGLGFAGLAYLPLPEVTAIGYAAPLLTVIFAAMFLGEDVRIFRISARARKARTLTSGTDQPVNPAISFTERSSISSIVMTRRAGGESIARTRSINCRAAPASSQWPTSVTPPR